MAWHLYERRGSPYTCFCCCHVRAGTLMLGCACLILKVLSIIATIIIKPQSDTDGDHFDFTTSKQGLNIFKSDGGLTSTTLNSSLWVSSTAVSHGDHRAIELVLSIGATLFTVSLLYGVIKGRPKYLLPHFCLQVFDFCLSALVIIGFFTYDPNIKPWLASQKWFPLRDQLMALSPGWLVLIAGCVAICTLWLKAYMISVVWNCYKYLIGLQSTLPIHGTAVIIESDLYNHPHYHETGTLSSSHRPEAASLDSDVSMMLPPKYEDVLQMPEPSSSESGASLSLPPAYNEVVLSDSAHPNQ